MPLAMGQGARHYAASIGVLALDFQAANGFPEFIHADDLFPFHLFPTAGTGLLSGLTRKSLEASELPILESALLAPPGAL